LGEIICAEIVDAIRKISVALIFVVVSVLCLDYQYRAFALYAAAWGPATLEALKGLFLLSVQYNA
jgi:hypothetical protein